MEGTKEIFAEAFRRLKVQNPDGKIVLLYVNKETQEKAIKLLCGKRMLHFTAAPKSFNTIIL